MSETPGLLAGLLLAPAVLWPFIYALSVLMTLIDPYRGLGWQVLARLHCWVWPLAGPGFLWMLSDAVGRQEYVYAGFAMLTLVLWWNAHDWPDDDQWKRRKKKVKQMVTMLGRRLVVRTAPA